MAGQRVTRDVWRVWARFDGCPPEVVDEFDTRREAQAMASRSAVLSLRSTADNSGEALRRSSCSMGKFWKDSFVFSHYVIIN